MARPRCKKALSSGLSVTLRRQRGELGGRMQLYSALNRDAARALRRGDEKTAARMRLKIADEATTLSGRVATLGSVAGVLRLDGALRLAVPLVDRVGLVEERGDPDSQPLQRWGELP